MYVCHTTKELRNEVSRVKKERKSIGLVTTMGALHEGHASLIKAARAENDFVIVTVFVNPTVWTDGRLRCISQDFGK